MWSGAWYQERSPGDGVPETSRVSSVRERALRRLGLGDLGGELLRRARQAVLHLREARMKGFVPEALPRLRGIEHRDDEPTILARAGEVQRLPCREAFPL